MSKNRTHKRAELLEIIPFSPMPSKDELSLASRVGSGTTKPKKGTNKKEPMTKERFLGKGAARETYALEADPENCVLKIARSRDGLPKTQQMKKEIETFIDLEDVRPWLPQIYSFDEKSYRWLVAERCDTNKAGVEKRLKEYGEAESESFFAALEKEAENGADLPLKVLRDSMGSLRHTDIKKGLSAAQNLLRRGFDVSSIRSGEDLAKALIPALEGKRISSSVANGLRSKQKAPRRRRRNQSKSTNEKLPKQEEMLLDVLRLSVSFLTCCHPLCLDLAIASEKYGINFRDLHGNNIGISRVKAAPYDIRLIDMGITKDIPNKSRAASRKKRPNSAKSSARARNNYIDGASFEDLLKSLSG